MICAFPGCGRETSLRRGQPRKYCSRACAGGSANLIPMEVRAPALDLIRQGKTVPEVARATGYQPKSIRAWCKAAGITPPRASRAQFVPPPPDKAAECERLLRAGVRTRSAAKQSGVSNLAATRIFRSLGLSRRHRPEAPKRVNRLTRARWLRWILRDPQSRYNQALRRSQMQRAA